MPVVKMWLGREDAASQRGASGVELALTLPLLLALLFGVVEFGLIIHTKGLITHASQEGARWGIIYSASPKTDGAIQTYVQDYLTGVGLTGASVKVSGAGSAAGEPLTVEVAYLYHFMVLPDFVTGLVGEVNLSAETVMRKE
jgi:Flp pilus assembly protein TadG